MAQAEDAADPVRFLVAFHKLPDGLRDGSQYHGGRVLFYSDVVPFASVEATNPEEFVELARSDPLVWFVYRDDPIQMIQHEKSPGVGELLDGHAAGAGAAFAPTSDPSYSSQYGPAQVRSTATWDFSFGFGSPAAAICVIDTGVRSTHQDISARWLGGIDFVNGDTNPADDNGHGTHVAGIAAADINNGVAIAGIGEVGIYGVKVLGAGGSGNLAAVAAGILWCAENTIARTVLSMSLSWNPSALDILLDLFFQNVINHAHNTRGKIIVAAAGNGGCTNCVARPALYANVLAVSCTTSTQSLCGFSSTGPQVDLAAPGDNIISLWHTSDTATNTISGTSMSTPHVSGAAAWFWSQFNGFTNTGIESRLTSTAEDLGTAGFDSSFGWGEVDLECLLHGTNPCPQRPVACTDAGPDASGYKCSLTTFSFENIASTGTTISLGDDQVSGAISMPFSKTFYGTAYSSVYVSSNGFLTFTATSDSGCCSGQAMPTSTAPNNLVAGFWEDLNPSAGGSIKYQTLGNSPSRRFVVQFTNVPHFADIALATFQIVLYEGSTTIDVRMASVHSDGGTHTTGVENSAGTVGLDFRNGHYTVAGQAARFNT